MSRAQVGEELEVEPIIPFRPVLPRVVELYMKKHRPSLRELPELVRSIEPKGTDIPMLVKQYLRFGARFHSIAVDRGFNATPGALLSADLRGVTPAVLKMYMGGRHPSFLRHHGVAAVG